MLQLTWSTRPYPDHRTCSNCIQRRIATLFYSGDGMQDLQHLWDPKINKAINNLVQLLKPTCHFWWYQTVRNLQMLYCTLDIYICTAQNMYMLHSSMVWAIQCSHSETSLAPRWKKSLFNKWHISEAQMKHQTSSHMHVMFLSTWSQLLVALHVIKWIGNNQTRNVKSSTHLGGDFTCPFWHPYVLHIYTVKWDIYKNVHIATWTTIPTLHQAS